ncbi:MULTISPECIES: glycoside hydrolase family 13 protein [unclassified Microbacterium]|uniref:glycoside hydrolase family 13 protein n=1 Tax=unclassified Microbacterium TaxID=2609290 RepID=UPI00214BDAE6|nr:MULTISPECIES: glycoside hydrolase family 13 protein [unclassified Microbacterium]MCR2782980.1 glycoside hydrolase family 13 protein [Microbacterium sp. zg.B96]WIM16133.1 glycoside hydrolase family 13 protein [Microbacterium sp. zg-B96]
MTLPETVLPGDSLADSRPGAQWWRTAVIYQIYPRSFADASGDGVGDLPGVTEHLDDLRTLGVDAIWLSPFQRSPQKDAGYDVSDYCDVDPLFGTLADFDDLIEAAHARGIRIIADLVPNHSSDQHVWFQQALAAAPASPERARYIFRDGKGADGELPPNNWDSVFGGPAWTRVVEPDGTPGQWYLHLFDTSQPDFDWSNPEVHEEFRRILRFWLDRGVDGFRVDVAHGLVKAEGLPDYSPDPESGSMGGDEANVPYWGQEGVHEIYRDWNKLLAEYGGDRALCAEAWLPTVDMTALWVRPDEMHQAFNFAYLETEWDAAALRDVVDESLRAYPAVGAPSTWVLSNHDVVRHASRLALTAENPQGHGIGPDSPGQPDAVLGLRRARAASAVMLALPGSAYIYQGEELGLPEVIHLPGEARQDPTWFRTDGERYGRDGCRVPIPWHADAPAYGFSPTGQSWLPQPEEWESLARDVQAGDPASTLSLYRTLLAARREHRLGAGTLEWLDGYGDDVLAFRNGDVTVIANLGEAPVELPRADLIAASEPVTGGILPTDTTVWLRAA